MALHLKLPISSLYAWGNVIFWLVISAAFDPAKASLLSRQQMGISSEALYSPLLGYSLSMIDPTFQHFVPPSSARDLRGEVIGLCEGTKSGVYRFNPESQTYLLSNDHPAAIRLWGDEWQRLKLAKEEKILPKLPRLADLLYGMMAGGRSPSIFSRSNAAPPYSDPVPERSNTSDKLHLFFDQRGKSWLSLVYGSDQSFKLLGPYEGVDWRSVAVSPDGKYAVVPVHRADSAPSVPLRTVMELINLDTRTAMQIPFAAQPNSISWAADSLQFIFRARSKDVRAFDIAPDLYRFDIPTLSSELLLEGYDAAWSPDGAWLAAWDMTQAKRDLILLRRDGRERRSLSPPLLWPSVQFGIVWSPDSQGFYWIAWPEGDSERRLLLHYGLQSGIPRPIFEFEASPATKERLLPSPDASGIILRSGPSAWYVCNSRDCRRFAPPQAEYCLNVDWLETATSSKSPDH